MKIKSPRNIFQFSVNTYQFLEKKNVFDNVNLRLQPFASLHEAYFSFLFHCSFHSGVIYFIISESRTILGIPSTLKNQARWCIICRKYLYYTFGTYYMKRLSIRIGKVLKIFYRFWKITKIKDCIFFYCVNFENALHIWNLKGRLTSGG